jgi:hypothetical protein
MVQMNTQPDLAARVARSIAHASTGDATMLVVAESEIERARSMIGDQPVIVATPQEARNFLTFMPSQAKEIAQ